MGVELAEKIILGMNSKARVDDLVAEFGEDVKKSIDLLSAIGLIEVRGGYIVITENGKKFKELPSV